MTQRHAGRGCCHHPSRAIASPTGQTACRRTLDLEVISATSLGFQSSAPAAEQGWSTVAGGWAWSPSCRCGWCRGVQAEGDRLEEAL